MRPTALLPAIALALGTTLAVATAPGHAANANNPYGNVDHRNDAGNDTGDSQVDKLNQSQLNENYRGPVTYPNGTTVVPPAAQPAPAYPAAPAR